MFSIRSVVKVKVLGGQLLIPGLLYNMYCKTSLCQHLIIIIQS